MKQKLQIGALFALLAVLIAVNVRYLLGPARSPAPIPASASELDDVVIGSVKIPDAELHVEMLQSRPGGTGRTGRSIFAYGSVAPPAEAAATSAAAAAPKLDPEPSPPLPPPTPRAPFRFFGIAVDVLTGGRHVFLTDGTEIYSARKGERIAKRYLVVDVRKDSLELEDTSSGQRWVLWLEIDRESR